MSLKNVEVDNKEMELETWPAFVDILSSTVVAIAFAFFILVVLLSMSKITTSSSSTEDTKSGSTSDDPNVEAKVISEKTSKFPRLSIVAKPATSATSSADNSKNISETDNSIVLKVPKDATVTNNSEKVVQPGSSNKQVLGEVPKFIDSRSMDVLKELVVVQQDVISQQRKVIDQQDKEIQQTTREYQSLLAVVTKEKEVEDVRQKINPKEDQALFNNIEKNGNRISGVDELSKGESNYLLSPPEVQVEPINIKPTPENGIIIRFNDNSDYFNRDNMNILKKQISNNIDLYKSRGVSIKASNSSFAISGSDSKRVSVNRLVLLRSLLVNMGVNPSLIKISTVDSNKVSEVSEEENYGSLEIVPNEG